MRIAVSFDHHGMSGACENAICRRNAPALHDQRSDRLRLVQQSITTVQSELCALI